jgi:hypothetical protein
LPLSAARTAYPAARELDALSRAPAAQAARIGTRVSFGSRAGKRVTRDRRTEITRCGAPLDRRRPRRGRTDSFWYVKEMASLSRYRGESMNAKSCCVVVVRGRSPLTVPRGRPPKLRPFAGRPAGSRGRTLFAARDGGLVAAARVPPARVWVLAEPALASPVDVSVLTRAAVTLARALATNRVLAGRGRRDRPLTRFSALPTEGTECDDMSARRTGCLRSTASTS